MEKNTNNYLIVEDSEIDVLITNDLIKRHYPTLQPIVTCNGVQAIKVLKERSVKGYIKPTFILLDLVMPLMDGFGFLDIYEQEIYRELKMPDVFILTSSIYEVDKRKAAKYKSVKAYLVKPFDIDRFVSINH